MHYREDIYLLVLYRGMPLARYDADYREGGGMRAQVIVLVVVAVTTLCLFGWLLGSSDNIGHEEPCTPPPGAGCE